jgi:hypothetical protein
MCKQRIYFSALTFCWAKRARARCIVRIITPACGAGDPGFKSQRARQSNPSQINVVAFAFFGYQDYGYGAEK